jgi:hypothetical protein
MRGMGLEEIIATSMRAFDERIEELVADAGAMCRDHGGTEDEIEFFMDMQRQRLAPERVAFEKKLRLQFEHGCNTELN